jgi:hypothetical protein
MRVIQHSKAFIATILVIAVGIYADAQIGLRLKYNLNDFETWNNDLVKRFSTDKTLFSTGYETGIDYWFRLKKYRIEFLPEVSFALASTKFENPFIGRFEFKALYFQFNTQIYFLDFKGDCDCPTFSKQGSTIKKGLFVHITPGFSSFKASGKPNPILSSIPIVKGEAEGWNYKLGVGIGQDFGWNNLITITPILSYNILDPLVWDKLSFGNGTYEESKTSQKQWQVTIRIGYRHDYKKRRR